MDSSQLSKKMRLEWSFKPVTIIMTVCGIPASHTVTRRFLKLIFHLIVVLSLSLNIFFNINSLKGKLLDWIENIMYPRMDGVKVWNSTRDGHGVPRKLMNFFSIIFKEIYPMLVPFLFAINYYFTESWGRIWACIQKIDQNIVASDKFYRQCRKGCIITSVLFYMPFLFVKF